jgi:class 3 adenylate cyclase
LLIYWEVTVSILLPIGQSFLFLINRTDPYWNSSNIFWSLFLGVATKSWWLPIHLLLGQAAGYWLAVTVWGPITSDKLKALLDQQVSIAFTACSGLGIKITLEIFHRRGLALAGANARAKEAESREAEIKPVQRELAVMFCDIRDFTHLTAAVEMRLRLQDFNREMFAQGKPKIRNGIGIAKGEVMLGNFGSFEKLDRTVIGEAVNIASRLEAKTKMYNLEVVVTEDIIRDLDAEMSHHRWIDLVRVKGSSRLLSGPLRRVERRFQGRLGADRKVGRRACFL